MRKARREVVAGESKGVEKHQVTSPVQYAAATSAN